MGMATGTVTAVRISHGMIDRSSPDLRLVAIEEANSHVL
jgi:hypothetical protein